jgi:hypothetical protein
MSSFTITSESQLPYTASTAGMIIYIGNSFTITNASNFITINASNVTINGQYNTITVSGVTDYFGFVQNGTGSLSSNLNVVIKNLTVNSSSSTLIAGGGWICQTQFCYASVLYCSSNGSISTNGGGIFGQACYSCSAVNCFSSGTISTNGGGIYGSYCVNCNASQCYSIGTIGDYAGGIFGFGNNQTTEINQNTLPTQPNTTISSSTATACYSTGGIGTNAGGIYGYYAYKSNAINCYTLGNGTTSSGGIFGVNFSSLSDTPTCSASYCYTIGTTLSGDGIYAYTGTNNSTNTECYCKSELNGIWKDCNAKCYLRNYDCVWIDISICSKHQPFLLKSFNRSLYTCPYQKIKCKYATSSAGLFGTQYKILTVNGKKNNCNITINSTNGVLTFDKVKKGKYKIKIINGTSTLINNICNNGYYIWSNYNINDFLLKSKYKSCKKKCKKSSSSSSSSSSSKCSYYC